MRLKMIAKMARMPVRSQILALLRLRIDPHLQLPDAQGRPVTIIENGRPLEEIFG